jgi:hypothetical protein
MGNGHRRSGNARLRGPGPVTVGAAPREMHHGIDRAVLERFYQGRRKLRGNGTVDNTYFGGDPAYRQLSEEIGGAILASQIQQRSVRISMLGDQRPHQIVHVATRGRYIREAGLARGLRAALANGEQRSLDQSFLRGIAGDRIQRIRAGDDDRAPLAGKVGGKRFYPHERRHQDIVPTGMQRCGSALAIGLGTGNDDSHGSIKKSGSGPMLEFTSSLGPNRGCIFAASCAGNVMGRGTIRPRDQSAKLHGITGNGCVAGNRRFA